MKAYRVVIGTLLIAGAAVSAQSQNVAQTDDCHTYLSNASSYQRAHIERAVKTYRACLESPNPGVVESALAHVAKMRLVLPEIGCKELEKRVDFLMTHGQTRAIRYKAYLTRMLFDNPDMFAQEGQVEFKESDELFGALASTLQQTLLGYNGQ